MSDNKLPNGIDRIVGQRMRWRRRELQWTQEQLGDHLGLTFQQVQKYEKGINRISAGRLFEMASVLAVPVTYFYEGVEDMLGPMIGALQESETPPTLPVMDGEAMDLVSAFQQIESPALRRSLLDTIRAAAASAPKKETDS